MFSVRQKREIADAVQKILRDTHHIELPPHEIQFSLHVNGAEKWSWADIRNNGAVTNPGVNPHNEAQDIGKIEYGSDEYDKFVEAYIIAEENGDDSFDFQGTEFSTSYAKHIIELIEIKGEVK